MRALQITILIFLFPFICFAQNKANPINITGVYNAATDNIKIDFEIANGSSNEKYDVTIEAYRNNIGASEKLNISSISGDLKDINASGVHHIFWNQRADGYVLDDDLTFKIYLSHKPNISYSKHLVKSLVFPGWGDYKIGNSKYYVAYGVLGYGLLGSSIWMNNQAFNSYNNYKKSFEIAESNKLFNTAKLQYKNSLILGGTAAIVWSYDLANVYYKVRRAKKDLNIKTSKYYYEKSLQRTESISPKLKFNTKNSYDIALEDGDKYFKQDKFKEAKASYEEALRLNPTSSIALKRNAELEQIIKNEDIKQNKYTEAITKGNEFLDEKDYTKALQSFEEAGRIKPNEKFPKDKINEIKNVLANIERDKNYNEAIKKGDEAFSENDFELAKQYYNQALTLKPSDPIVLNKIEKVENAVLVAEKNRITKEIKSLENKAQNAFDNKNYDEAIRLADEILSLENFNPKAEKIKQDSNNRIEALRLANAKKEYNELIIKARIAKKENRLSEAKVLYEQASELFPQESEPVKQLRLIESIINDNSGSKNNLSTLYKECKKSVFFVFTSDYENVSQGSGFFITESGIAVSNYHVFEGTYMSTARIYTEDGTKYEIELLEKNEELDYIIFKVKNSRDKFQPVKIAKKTPEIGESVFAIGNPEGMSQTLSNGIISSYRENKDYIQTTTPITHGSSGGPLFNSNGEAIGITTKGLQDGSLFFCINIQRLPLWKYLNK
jgi:serine protease Do